MAALARRQVAARVPHCLILWLEQMRADGVIGKAAIAPALTRLGVRTPRGSGIGTHTTVSRVLVKAGFASQRRQGVTE